MVCKFYDLRGFIMIIAIILILILLISTITGVMLFIKEHNKLNKLRTYIAAESKYISNKMGKVVYGLLDQHLKIDTAGIKGMDNILENIKNIKKNFNDITSEPILRLCYVGTDAWFEGCYCATIIAGQINKKGKIAILVTSNLRALIMAQRHRSFVTEINEKYPDITVEETFEALADQDKAADFVSRIALKVDAIYITGNSAASGAARGLEQAGRVGKVFMLCHDLDQSIAANIDKGVISASLVCSTVAQGRDPVLHIFNHIVTGWKPKQPRLFIPLQVVKKSNLNEFWNIKENYLVEQHNSDKGSIVPKNKSNSLVRIIAIAEDWNNAFVQMKSGIQIAADILKPYNAEVIIYTINQLKRPKDEVYNDLKNIFENECKKGMHGIVSFVGSQDIVSLLNEQNKKGIPIATFDSEPFNLRSMVLWLSQSSIELEHFSDEYMSGHHEINMAVQQILVTLNNMVDHVNKETESITEGAKAVNELMGLIENTVSEEEQQKIKISSTSKISSSLSDMVEFFTSKVEGLKVISDKVILSDNKSKIVKKLSDKMVSIVNIIDDISRQTNLLAINASIEAARRGESGKGFNVIAKEIRDLSSKSKTSTDEVSRIIDEMKSSIDDSTNAIEATKFIVNEQVTSITGAVESLFDLSKQLISIMESIQIAVEKNTRKMLGMKERAESLKNVVNNSTSIAVENSKSIESLSSMFTEISTQFNEMNNKTKELGEIIFILHNTVSQFN